MAHTGRDKSACVGVSRASWGEWRGMSPHPTQKRERPSIEGAFVRLCLCRNMLRLFCAMNFAYTSLDFACPSLSLGRPGSRGGRPGKIAFYRLLPPFCGAGVAAGRRPARRKTDGRVGFVGFFGRFSGRKMGRVRFCPLLLGFARFSGRGGSGWECGLRSLECGISGTRNI